MVEENQTYLSLRPEEKTAFRFLKKLKCSIPGDVEAIASSLADIETDFLPRGADALLLPDSKARKRPLIILQHNLPSTRRRFTLAHEIGHIRIPWHVGTILCHPDSQSAKYLADYNAIETEANRFASEFLLPLDWLTSLMATQDSPEQKFLKAQQTGVSDAVVTIALGRVRGTGLVFANVDSGHVMQASISPGTYAVLPRSSDDIEDWKAAFDRASDGGIFYGRSNQIFWWSFEQKLALIDQDRFTSSAQVLDTILAQTHPDPVQAKSVRTSIYSITGGLSGANRKSSAEELFALCKYRLERHSNDEVRKCYAHEDFKIYLSLRCRELFAIKKW